MTTAMGVGAHRAFGRRVLARGRHERQNAHRTGDILLWLRSRLGLVIGAAMLALLSGAAGAFVAVQLRPVAATVDLPAGSSVISQPPAATIEQAAAKAIPSVVKLETVVGNQTEEGSGVVLRADGLILTNYHVVSTPDPGQAGPAVTLATLADGRAAPFTIVGSDAGTDIAVVRVQGISGLKPITMGSSTSLHVGQHVIAIGSPLGLDSTVTTGIISALHRPVSSIAGPGGGNTRFDAIQTDATMSPGSSGGALVDTTGALVGLNSAIATMVGAYPGGPGGWTGVGFAIPADQAKGVADQLIANGKARNLPLGHG